jgi:hypothetical protein
MRTRSFAHASLARLLIALFLVLATSLPSAFAESPAASQDETRVLAAYALSDGKLTPDDPAPASKEERATHEKYWAAVKTLIPADLLGKVGRLEVFAVDAGKSDEVDSTDGYANLSDDGSYFVLGLNDESAKAAFIDRDLDALKDYEATIIHEFGHVLSLEPGQMVEAGEEEGISLDEGKLRKDAFLNRFYESFWKQAYPSRGAETKSDEEGSALYAEAPDAFVTEYAATGPLEDFAESFARFVVGDKPSGSAIKTQKVLFFYQSAAVVSLRGAIRKGIAALGGN